jgi:uncharacterized membrane protein YedE/YeeE
VLNHQGNMLDTIAFTPIESLAGGCIMGMAVYHHLRANGRITGVSGIVGGILDNCEGDRLWRSLFVFGMLLAGVILKVWQSRGPLLFFEDHYAAVPLLVYVVAGFLGGAGTRIGSGCSSGHMLVGLARASTRSLFATLVFSGVAGIVTTIVSTFHDEHKSLHSERPWIAPTKWASQETTTLLASLTFASWLAFRTVIVLQRMQVINVTAAKDFISFLTGLFFSLGLGITGMTRQSKVHNFLNLRPIFTHNGTWDPSLVMVLIGAMIPNMIFYHLRVRKVKPHFETKLHLPTKTDLDKPLLVGAALFGVSWGLVSICPGPALANLGGLISSMWMPSALTSVDYQRMFAFFGSMLVGMSNYKQVASALGL